jgi:TonB-dependent receptor
MARVRPFSLAAIAALAPVCSAAAQEVGSIRGVVHDGDFDVPIAGAEVSVVETGLVATTGEQGNYLLGQLPPGIYTLIFAKDGYVRQVKTGVVVTGGQLTDLDVWLAGEFAEMEEFVVEDLLAGGGSSEAALIDLRLDSPGLLDSIGADLMSRAGASDAASALRLVPGASLQDGKSAVIRGLPDRYVSSQLNGVRLPSADAEKRAVELDQFPAAAIESIQVSKTFTPDQQGDASGGAVDVRLKGLPQEGFFEIKGQYSYNSQVQARDDFLTYRGGGLSFWGIDEGSRDIQFDQLGQNWDGAVGVSRGEAPIDTKWSLAAGDNWELDGGDRIGLFGSFFYERDSSYYDNGREDLLVQDVPNGPLVPQTIQGDPGGGDFKTALFDVTQGSQSVQWGGLSILGYETDGHELGLAFLHTRSAEDTATLAEDTRGKEFFFPGHDPDVPGSPGNDIDSFSAAPYIRTETLSYVERTTTSAQLSGGHELETPEFEVGAFRFQPLELDWTLSRSSADYYEPDKRQFGSQWIPNGPGIHSAFKPDANFTVGNLQRTWEEVDEQSSQLTVDFTLPFLQWDDEQGRLRSGFFVDRVERTFDQDTFSNFNDNDGIFLGSFDEFWSESFPNEPGHEITAANTDVDYEGDIDIEAFYGMFELPLTKQLDLVAGARVEATSIGITNIPEVDALWIPPGATQPIDFLPGDADVVFEQTDLLPAVGLIYELSESVTLRASWSQTVARQTFRELTPILQQEFLGGPVFIGNPNLQMSSLDNYDLRADYAPYEGSLVSASWFYKDIRDPIEVVQAFATFDYDTVRNYPEGELSGFEFEVRQDIGRFANWAKGFSAGANATLIDSQVTLPADEVAIFAGPAIAAPFTTRPMTSAPEHLYNLFLTYDQTELGTQLALFYTVQGDTLVAGAGVADGGLVPNVFAAEFDTLNASFTQKLGPYLKLQIQAKNLTNPEIEEVYRSSYIGPDVTKSSFTRGIDYSIGLSASFAF